MLRLARALESMLADWLGSIMTWLDLSQLLVTTNRPEATDENLGSIPDE